MKRREALRNVAILLGTAISASTLSVILEGCNNEKSAAEKIIGFSNSQVDVLTEFADIIVPKTQDSGGAKDAGVGAFIPVILNDCFPAAKKEQFLKGLEAFAKATKDKYGKDFVDLSADQKLEAVKALREFTLAEKDKKGEEKDVQAHFFIVARDLTMLGYYSSEIGCTQALANVEIPGKYQGDVPLKPGQKRWAQ